MCNMYKKTKGRWFLYHNPIQSRRRPFTINKREATVKKRECGCPIPKDYPKIDIHNSRCKRRRWLEGPSAGNKGEIPKVYPSGRKVRRGDGPPRLTPIHQTNSKQWFFGHDYDGFVDPRGNVWIAMAKRFDKRYNKP